MHFQLGFCKCIFKSMADKEALMFVFELYDDSGLLAYVGRNWDYARRYLDYLVRTLPDPPQLVIRWEAVKPCQAPV